MPLAKAYSPELTELPQPLIMSSIETGSELASMLKLKPISASEEKLRCEKQARQSTKPAAGLFT
jgi:hypothetical protein